MSCSATAFQTQCVINNLYKSRPLPKGRLFLSLYRFHVLVVPVKIQEFIGPKGGAANFCLQKSRMLIGRIGIFIHLLLIIC